MTRVDSITKARGKSGGEKPGSRGRDVAVSLPPCSYDASDIWNLSIAVRELSTVMRGDLF